MGAQEEKPCLKCGEAITAGEEYDTGAGEFPPPNPPRQPTYFHAKACQFMKDFAAQLRTMAPGATVRQVGTGNEQLEVKEAGKEMVITIERSLGDVSTSHAVEMAMQMMAHLRTGAGRTVFTMLREGGVTVVK